MSRSGSGHHYRRHTVSRRALLSGSVLGGAGLAAYALACGESKSTPGAATKVETAIPQEEGHGPGGVLRLSATADADSFDPHSTVSFRGLAIGAYVYDRLFKFKTFKGQVADGTVEGNLVTKWEQPDRTTVVATVRPEAKWDGRSPTNGRKVTAEDVALGFEKYATKQPRRVDLVNAANSTAPIASMKAINENTVEIKLAHPDAGLIEKLCSPFGYYVLPKDAVSGGFDPVTDMRGSGPWMLDGYRPSVGWTFKKNPNYWGAPQSPLLDGIELPIIPDASQAEAQFKAGRIHFGGVSETNMLSLYAELKGQAKIVLAPPSPSAIVIGFGWRPGSPFHDVRVRRALSMLIDRDTVIDTFSEPKRFRDAGIGMQGYWATPLTKTFGDQWLDPKSPEFGPHAKNYTHNVAEANRLLDAAGYAGGLTFSYTISAGNEFGRDWGRRAEAFAAMMQASDRVKVRMNPVDFTTVYNKQYNGAQGDYDGVIMDGGSGRSEPSLLWIFHFSPKGFNSLVGGGKFGGDRGLFPELLALLEKYIAEFDRNERKKVLHDMQRLYADQVPAINPQGQTEVPVIFHQGVHGVAEYSTYQGIDTLRPQELYPLVSIDKSLRT